MVRVEVDEEKQQFIMFSPVKNELQKAQGNMKDIHPLFINNHYCYILEPEFKSKQVSTCFAKNWTKNTNTWYLPFMRSQSSLKKKKKKSCFKSE